LEAHHDVFVPKEKEQSAFYDDPGYNRRFEKCPYDHIFKHWSGEKYAGNAPVNSLYFSEQAARNIFHFNPNMKLIAILRNPIDRAYSAYWYFIRTGLESECFEAALERENYILEHGSFVERSNFTYVSHGLYYKQLIDFYRFFNPDQILILLFEDLKSDARKVLNKIYEFLGIKERYPKDLLGKKFNKSSKSRYQALTNLIYHDSGLKTLYQRVAPVKVRNTIRSSIIRRIAEFNKTSFEYPPMPDALRHALRRRFRKANRSLERLLGCNLSAWL
jgi:hypothetical protein